jgi:hypothetical protein
MKYLKFTYVDAQTGISIAAQPATNGPKFPPVVGLSFVWARESAYPTDVPQFFGTCPDDADTQIDGVLGIFGQADWEQMQADEMERRPDPEAKRIASLWQAAHDLEYNAISGSAIGLITMGVMTGKPKCLAVQGWIKDLWTEYYTRKATASSDCDFTVIGPCPHSVPELMAELGV